MKTNIAAATLAILALSVFVTAASAANGGYCRSVDSQHQTLACNPQL